MPLVRGDFFDGLSIMVLLSASGFVMVWLDSVSDVFHGVIASMTFIGWRAVIAVVFGMLEGRSWLSGAYGSLVDWCSRDSVKSIWMLVK